MLDRDAIMAVAKGARPVEQVSVPALGGDVLLAGVTAGEYDAWDREWRTEEGRKPGAYAAFLALAIRGPDGERLLRDEDAGPLAALPAGIVDRLFGVAIRLSGFGPEAQASAEKNSPPEPSGGG